MEKLKRPITIDIFCGAGGLSLGFKQAGFNLVAGFDFDTIHVDTHAKNFPKSTSICADIRTLSGKKIRQFAKLPEDVGIDVVVGGPPCQGFSMIGKRNMKDPRNQLLGEFCRVVKELSPSYFVIENVAGLVYGEARKILAAALRDFKKAGYCWVTPIRVLDAADFGVPQRRKRVFVLGYKRGLKKPEYPKPTGRHINVRQAIGDLTVLGRKRSLLNSDLYTGKLGRPSRYAQALRQRLVPGTLSGCLRAQHKKAVVKRFLLTKPGQAEPISHFIRLHQDSPAPTLRAGTAKAYGGFTAARPIHPTQARCITVREAARIHSFPDSFQFHPTQWHGFRQVGNAVPPLLARLVGRKLHRTIMENHD